MVPLVHYLLISFRNPLVSLNYEGKVRMDVRLSSFGYLRRGCLLLFKKNIGDIEIFLLWEWIHQSEKRGLNDEIPCSLFGEEYWFSVLTGQWTTILVSQSISQKGQYEFLLLIPEWNYYFHRLIFLLISYHLYFNTEPLSVYLTWKHPSIINRSICVCQRTSTGKSGHYHDWQVNISASWWEDWYVF